MTNKQYMEDVVIARQVQRKPPRKPKRITKKEAEGILNRIIKRQAVANGYLDPQKPKFIWAWDCDGLSGGKVEGNSKSDARGEIKKALGIPQKQRLPVGIKITKLCTNPGTSMPVAAVIEKK